LVSGRTFTAADVVGAAPVAVISETTARTFWPGTNALGQCVKLGADSMPCTTVVGVVTDARRQQLVEDPTSQIYRPLDQLPPSITDGTVSFSAMRWKSAHRERPPPWWNGSGGCCRRATPGFRTSR